MLQVLMTAVAPAPAPGSGQGLALVDRDEAVRLAELFRLLGDPTRTRLLHTLRQAGELCVTELAEAVEAPEPSVSQALRLLRTAGVVRNRRQGRLVFYSLDDDHVRDLLDRSLEHLRHGAQPSPTTRTDP